MPSFHGLAQRPQEVFLLGALAILQYCYEVSILQGRFLLFSLHPNSKVYACS